MEFSENYVIFLSNQSKSFYKNNQFIQKFKDNIFSLLKRALGISWTWKRKKFNRNEKLHLKNSVYKTFELRPEWIPKYFFLSFPSPSSVETNKGTHAAEILGSASKIEWNVVGWQMGRERWEDSTILLRALLL